jgi:hypothetical protein
MVISSSYVKLPEGEVGTPLNNLGKTDR